MRLLLALLLLALPASAGARTDPPLRLANSAPSCSQQTFYNAKNHTPYQVTLACTDSDGDPLTYTADNPQHGTLSTVTGDKVTFTPTGDYDSTGGTGYGEFDYHASDGTLTGDG